MEIGNVTVLDGTDAIVTDVVILDAATARNAIAEGQLEQMVDAGLRALELTGKRMVYLKEAAE